jgi:hypothetical protein
MRRTTFSFSILLALAIALAGFAGSSVPASDKPKAEELVSKHLDALGTPQARAALKSLNVEGNLMTKFLRGGAGAAGGPFAMVSTGHKILMEAKFNIPTYSGESFAFDGEKKTIGFVTPGQRSQLEDFLNNNGEVLADGLIGGTLTTAWPLYDWQSRNAKLDVDGLKKVDGKELFRVTYHPRHGGGDLKIYLFFDPETLRHVKTIYSQQSQAQMGTSADRSSLAGAGGGSGASLMLEEDFGGFAPVNKLMLPTQWTLKYSQEGIGNGSSMVQFDMVIAKIQANPNVSGVTFRIQ